MKRTAKYPGWAPEWPTILIALVIYGGWTAITWFHDRLPIWILVPVGAWLIAWHGSLQHETIHGHPTASPRLNALIGGLPLALWLPYRCYRRDHIAHHATETVTDPVKDPESRYLMPSRGLVATLHRGIALIQAPLIGRLAFGPLLSVGEFFAGEARRMARTPAIFARDWAPHLLGLAVVGGWLWLCQMSLGLYLLAFVYPGTALTLLRSFAEHRAAELPEHRVAVVERAGPFALLFLNNNLHAAHHRAPGLAWFRLPAFYRLHRTDILRRNGGLLYRGYHDVVRRFAIRPHDVLIHPLIP